MPLDPEQTYVHLAESGYATEAPGGAEFWPLPATDMARFDQGWLVSEFVCSEDWNNWEVHPNGDEFVYLLSGDVEPHLERPQGLSTERITGRGARVIPRNVWHTAKVFAPSRMFFITRGEGTHHRATSGADPRLFMSATPGTRRPLRSKIAACWLAALRRSS